MNTSILVAAITGFIFGTVFGFCMGVVIYIDKDDDK